MTFFSTQSITKWIVVSFLGTQIVACGAADLDTDRVDKSQQNEAAADADEDAEFYDSGPLLTGNAANTGGAGPADELDDTCFRLASIGRAGQLGVVAGQGGYDAVGMWLNESSNAQAVHYPTPTELTAELLDGVDVVLLQNLRGWDFSDQELKVFESWVRGGGALMALAGYSDDGEEVLPTNKLLSFTGMNFVGISGPGDTALNLGECSFCLGKTYSQGGWIDLHPISEGIEAVGAFQGRSILGDGEVVASEQGKVLAMSKQVVEGRALLFHDEWVSYVNQWNGEATMACSENAECSDLSPQTSYQMSRFWFNSLKWLTRDLDCFRIDSR